ncbi:MAG: hypothetical protein ACOY90_02635 [Candidatus Zhuqueibacterota bacterium]
MANPAMQAKSSDLIFFYSHEQCPARAAGLPVLAWLAEKHGLDYDGYFAVAPSVADIGDALPYTGNKHDEQFYYLCNFYDQVHFFALTEEAPIQFERFLRARNRGSLVKKSSAGLVDFFVDVFDQFREPLPEEAVVFSAEKFSFPNERIELGDFIIPGESRLDTFCFPEIFHRQSLACHYELDDSQWQRLVALGLKKVHLIFCPQEAAARFEKLGVAVSVIDSVQPGDSYVAITERMARRWISEARGLALGNDPITLRWTPKYLRERILAIAAVQTLPRAVELLGELTDTIGNKLVWGSQVFNDKIIADASKHDIILSLVHDVELGITLKNKIRLPNDWLNDVRPVWQQEFSDAFLAEQLESNKIPVCFLHYASDLGHLPALPRILDLHSIRGMRAGLAFPSSWWEYAEEGLEQLYLSAEMGGVYPSIEPLLVSAGVGVATEAQGYLSPAAYLGNLKKAFDVIAQYAGRNHVPIGHYSFQDACPRYDHNTGEPQFEVLADAGFKYAITYKHENQFPEIVFEKNEFIVLNEQSEHWSFNPLADLMKWERAMVDSGRNGWIMIGLDSPFWGFVPCYFGLASKGLSLTDLQKAMTYAKTGGESRRLFLAKPHEVVRFAQLMKRRGQL